MLGNGLEPWQLLIVAIVVILLFGPKELPGTAHGPGRLMRILQGKARSAKGEGGARSVGASIESMTTPASTESAGRVLRAAVPSGTATVRPVTKGRRAR
ncbi:twin-arginine translocase TatA/TatE family subunit [Streptomyces sp. NPDC052101]|uniref:twin-arginine translocase TatA/TatE family subunit n=1 Tax=Streptomyces sp. NPDC052101 TaxID=3155763 RepID=UPI00342BBEFE